MIAIEVHLDADAAATMAQRRPRGPARRAEGAGAEVLLRRARLAALRADHRAGRVLPDPGRARDPRRALGRDRRRRRRARDAGRARLRLGREDPPPARARCATPAASRPTSRSTSPRRSPTRPPAAGRRVPGPRTSTASSATSSTHLERIPDGDGGAPDRLPRRHDRQPLPGARGARSWPGSRR